MIRYALACDEGHAFESWFANSATYDRQVKRGLVSCPVCNSTKVEKAIMAPQVAGTKRRGDVSVSAPMPEGPASSPPSASNALPETPQTNVPAPVAMMSPQEREFRSKLKELREHLIRTSAARFTARPRLTRPRSCMRKESSFTRCPCCRTSGTDRVAANPEWRCSTVARISGVRICGSYPSSASAASIRASTPGRVQCA